MVWVWCPACCTTGHLPRVTLTVDLDPDPFASLSLGQFAALESKLDRAVSRPVAIESWRPALRVLASWWRVPIQLRPDVAMPLPFDAAIAVIRNRYIPAQIEVQRVDLLAPTPVVHMLPTGAVTRAATIETEHVRKKIPYPRAKPRRPTADAPNVQARTRHAFPFVFADEVDPSMWGGPLLLVIEAVGEQLSDPERPDPTARAAWDGVNGAVHKISERSDDDTMGRRASVLQHPQGDPPLFSALCAV